MPQRLNPPLFRSNLRSSEIRETIQDKYYLEHLLHNLGDAYKSKDDFSKAGKLLERSLSIQKEIRLG